MKIQRIRNEASTNTLVEVKGNVFFSGKHIKYGEDNLLPQYFMKLAREVWSHRALMNSKSKYCAGSFISETPSTEKFLKRVNKTESATDIIKKLLFDEFAVGYSVLDIVTDERGGWLQLYHLDATKGRLLTDNTGMVFMPDWAKPKEKEAIEIPFYPNFQKVDQDGMMHSIILKKNYEPMFTNGVPSWFAGLKKAVISGLIDVSNKSELETGHSLSGMLFIPNVTDPNDAELLEEKIEDIKGAENHGDILVGYYESMGGGKDTAPNLIDFRGKNEGDYINLNQVVASDLVVVHEWFRALSGFTDNTGFDVSRIIDEYEVALAGIITSKQLEYSEMINPVLDYFGYGEGIFKNQVPYQQIKDEDLKAVWEVRKDRGMDYDKEQPEQQRLIIDLKQKT